MFILEKHYVCVNDASLVLCLAANTVDLCGTAHSSALPVSPWEEGRLFPRDGVLSGFFLVQVST